MSRVTWISPDECDLRVWAWAGVPHHALDVEAGGGPGHGDVQPLHVSRVTCHEPAGTRGHVSPGSTSRPCRTDSGCRWGWWPAAAPPAWPRVTSHVTSCVTCDATLPGEEVLHDVWDLLRVPEQVSGHVTM